MRTRPLLVLAAALTLLFLPAATAWQVAAQTGEPAGTEEDDWFSSRSRFEDGGPKKLQEDTREMARQASERMARLFFWCAVGLLGAGVGIFVIKMLFNVFIVPVRQRDAQKRYFESRRSPLEVMIENAEKIAVKKDGLPEAADLFEQAGALDRAAECAEELGEQRRAARLWEIAGHTDRAAQILLKLNDHQAAAEVFHNAGAYVQAADAYRAAGMLEKAAGQLEQADRKVEAARIYEELGNLHRAARIYEEAGDAERASELLGRLADQGLVSTPQDAEHLASLLEQTGRQQRAAEYYALAGDLVRAIEILIGNGDVDRAAELYSGCSENLAPQILARIPYDSPVAPRYAQLFLRARDYASAARAFEALGRYEEAAELYSRCNDHYQAGEMYHVLGDKNRAAEALERGGDHVRAAELFELLGKIGRAAANYEAAGESFRAGKLYFSLDDRERALGLLQKVTAGSDDYFQASVLVSRLMLERGFYDGAERRLLAITEGLECQAATAEAFYTLGIIELRLGNQQAALDTLVKVADHDYQFRDASQLLAALRAGGIQAAEALLPGVAQVERTASFTGLPAAAEGGGETGGDAGQVVNVRKDFRFLQGIPLFGDFSLEELRQLWQITEERKFAAGTMILEEGGVGPGLFVIQSGHVSIRRLQPAGEWELNRLGEEEYFGEISLAAAIPVTARVRADSDVEVLFLPRAPLLELMEGNDGVALKLYRTFTKTLAGRLKATTDELLGKMNAPPRGAGDPFPET